MPGNKKNILYVIADDLGNNLGCYGDKIVKTPNIDAFAASGVLFDYGFASTASCSGSRSTVYTGLHTHSNGQYGLAHNHHHFTTFDNVDTLPKLFNEGGYLTGIVNKVHVGPKPVYPWTERHESGTRDVKWAADTAGEIFVKAKEQDKPFCVIVAFMDPHRDATRDGFANVKDYPGVQDIKYDPETMKVPFYLPDLPEVRQEFAEYYRSISRMDQGFGMILKHLEAVGAADDTLVIFTSDNGSPFPNSKTTLYEAGVRLPFIARCPGGPTGKVDHSMISWVDVLPSFIDYAGINPVSNPQSPQRPGTSFIPLLRPDLSPPKPGPHNGDEIYGSHTFHEITNYYPTRFLRTRRYKYHRNVAWKIDFPFSTDLYSSLTWEAIRNAPKAENGEVMVGPRKLSAYIARGPEELYDLENDPEEVTNLAEDPAHAKLLHEMRAKVEAWQKATEDPWLYKDGQSLRAIQKQINHGMAVPDRFDFDLKQPASLHGVKTVAKA